MINLPRKEMKGCQEFREELVALTALESAGSGGGTVLEKMSPASQEHARGCPECREAAVDMAATRDVLQPLAQDSVQPGPWFAVRVMTAIKAREAEMDLQEGVWMSVRRLAPRLVAVCALLLLLASTWAYQVRRSDQARTPQVGANETVLDPAQSTPLNDDVLASNSEMRR
jgi:hypothetical protein